MKFKILNNRIKILKKNQINKLMKIKKSLKRCSNLYKKMNNKINKFQFYLVVKIKM